MNPKFSLDPRPGYSCKIIENREKEKWHGDGTWHFNGERITHMGTTLHSRCSDSHRGSRILSPNH